MTASNNPQHGEEIIVSRQDSLGRTKLIASFTFQRFLDSLGSLEDQTSETINLEDTEQIAASLQAFSSSFNGKIRLNTDNLEDLEQLFHGS